MFTAKDDDISNTKAIRLQLEVTVEENNRVHWATSDDFFHRAGDSLLAGGVHNHVVLAPDTVRVLNVSETA